MWICTSSCLNLRNAFKLLITHKMIFGAKYQDLKLFCKINSDISVSFDLIFNEIE